MRPSLLPALLALSLASESEAHADIRRELVARLAAPRAGSPATAGLDRLAPRFAALGLRVRRTLADGLPAPASLTPRDRVNAFDFDPSRWVLLEARDSSEARAAIGALRNDPALDWIEPNRPRTLALAWLAAGPAGADSLPAGFPDDPLFRDSRQWGLMNRGPAGVYGGVAGADIHALEAWNLAVGANDVMLAIADTGIDPMHPDLQATLPDGGPRVAFGWNATDEISPSYADSFGHGTPVAGVVAARTNNGVTLDSLGAAGVCGGDGTGNFGCRIVPIKIASGHSGEASSFDIARAILYAVALGARAVNLSFAGDQPDELERSALYYALTRGCVVVAAAGNRGYSFGTEPQYPAAYAAEGLCIQVGASDELDHRTLFSSYGPGLDLVAPGVDIWTTFMTYPSSAGASYPGYVAAAGTSFAAPFVTGTVGLLAAARPELGDTDFQHVIRESADDIGAQGVDAQTGHGRLNAAAALRAVAASIGILHGEAAGQDFRELGLDTLVIGGAGSGAPPNPRHVHRAVRIEVTATVAIPDSFLDSVRIWPRIGGTSTLRGDFRLPDFTPWCEVEGSDGGSFTLRGFIYRVIADNCPDCLDDQFVPVPPDQAQFGFTVMGRVDRAPALAVASPVAGTTVTAGDSVTVRWSASDPDTVSAIEVWFDPPSGAALRLARVANDRDSARVALPCAGVTLAICDLRIVALDEHGPQRDSTAVAVALTVLPAGCASVGVVRLRTSPNPFGTAVRIDTPGAGTLAVLDLAGRVMLRTRLAGAAHAFVWDGRDARGRDVPAGLYLVRFEGALGIQTARLARIR